MFVLLCLILVLLSGTRVSIVGVQQEAVRTWSDCICLAFQIFMLPEVSPMRGPPLYHVGEPDGGVACMLQATAVFRHRAEALSVPVQAVLSQGGEHSFSRWMRCSMPAAGLWQSVGSWNRWLRRIGPSEDLDRVGICVSPVPSLACGRSGSRCRLCRVSPDQIFRKTSGTECRSVI